MQLSIGSRSLLTMSPFVLAAALVSVPTNVDAQITGDYVPDALPEEVERGEADMWHFGLAVGASLSFGDSRAVVGQQDGSTLTGSLTLDGSVQMIRNAHEWRTTLHLTETVTRTPSIDEFIKAADVLRIESTYYFLVTDAPPFGPFARATAETALFGNSDVRGEENIYAILPLGATERELTGPLSRLFLTDAFSPLTLKQSVGAFVRPLSSAAAALNLRLGVGARELFADGQLAVSDDADTAEIEVNELQSYTQAGGEVALDFSGAVADGTVTYSATAEMMTPFYDSIDDDAFSAFEATNYELGAALGFRLTSWASLDYRFTARKLPRLVDDWQISNNLLLTFSHTILE